MFDWNKDGKTDYKDDYIYHEVLNDRKNDGNSNSFPSVGGYRPHNVQSQKSPSVSSTQSRSSERKTTTSTSYLLTELFAVIGALALVILLIKAIYY